MIDLFDTTKPELYSVWMEFTLLNANGTPVNVAINKIHQHPELYSTKALNYFLALGLSLFNKEYLKELEGSDWRHIDKQEEKEETTHN